MNGRSTEISVGSTNETIKPATKVRQSLTCGFVWAKRNKPITNGVTPNVHTTSQRTVCLTIRRKFHRSPRAGSKNLVVRIRSGYDPRPLSYDEKTRRTAASKMGVMTTRADLDCR